MGSDAEASIERLCRDLASGLSGPIVNSGDVPADKQAGALVELEVSAVTATEISFRYPTGAAKGGAGLGSKQPPKKGKH